MTTAAEHQVAWHEDATNAETKYLRNQIRHQVMPVLAALRPGYEAATVRAAMLRHEQKQEHLAYVASLVKDWTTEQDFR